MKIAVLTTANQWFEKYAIEMSKKLKCALYFNHEEVRGFDVVFILSYHQLIQQEVLQSNKHNIVIHESALPQGKGWAPLFWQVLEGKNEIPFTMFEASTGIDNGDIYMQKILSLTGYELNNELREKQAMFTMTMCLEFLADYNRYKVPEPQVGKETVYSRRTPKDSQLDIDKTIKEQFNLLRIVNNDEYPAFFEIDGYKYILKIEDINNKNR